jgi:hypothetical protein
LETQLKQEQLITQILDEIEIMTDAWTANIKLKTETQKKAFLTDYMFKCKTIGIGNTVDSMLPCLVNAYLCDQVTHPSIYDNFAHLLFGNMTELLRFLSKQTRRQMRLQNCQGTANMRRRSVEESLLKVNQVEGSGTEVKASLNSEALVDNSDMVSENSDTESEASDFDVGEITESPIDPNYGLGAISTVLLPRIYETFFAADRHDDELKQSLLPQVLEQMVLITKLLSPQQREKQIVPIILGSLSDKDDEQRRITGVTLLDELAETLGEKICQEMLLYDLISLQDDPVFKVRRELVSRLHMFSKQLGEQVFTGVIVPVYRKLSQDQIWSVRKACVELLPQIASLSSEQTKNSQLVQLFDKFSKDSNKWVKVATFQYFGPFMFNFEKMAPNETLMEYFLSMGQHGQAKIQSVDNDTAFHCAYNFPAVLKTLGGKYWKDKLKPMHDQMVIDNRWKVRRSLAFSIHECAQILGPELTENDLLPVLFHFLQDITEVAEGALENLPLILKVLRADQRDQYVDLFIEAQNKVEKANIANWRQRQQMAGQIKEFAALISPEKLDQFYAPKFFELCLDEVAQVREAASLEATAAILHNFAGCDSEQYLAGFIEQMQLFKESNRYNYRQTFLGMIRCIFCDFCQLKDQATNLIEVVIIKHFTSDLIDLS